MSDGYELTDSFSVIAPRCSGGISTISSMLIIYIINQSNERLTTIYHRIMLGMSLACIIGSIAIGLSTLPMPRDGGGVDNNLHEGSTKLGNDLTCDLQGVFITFGQIATFLYNASLWIYYAYSIASELTEVQIRKRREPVFHGIPVIGSSFMSVATFFRFGFAATNKRPFCSSGVQLIDQGEAQTFAGFLPRVIFALVVFAYVFVAALVSLIKIMHRVWWKERDVHVQTTSTSNVDANNIRMDWRNHVRAMLIQALVYLVSYTLTIAPLYVLASQKTSKSEVMLKIQMFIFPLQGFFNFIIFFAHKLHNNGRVHEDLTLWENIKKVLAGECDNPVIISRISLIQEDIDVQESRFLARYDGIGSKSAMQISSSTSSKKENHSEYANDFSDFEIPSIQSSSMNDHSSNIDPKSNIKVTILYKIAQKPHLASKIENHPSCQENISKIDDQLSIERSSNDDNQISFATSSKIDEPSSQAEMNSSFDDQLLSQKV